MICKFCQKIMFDNESDKTYESYICNCEASCSMTYRDIPASAHAIGRMRTSLSWFNPKTGLIEREDRNERVF